MFRSLLYSKEGAIIGSVLRTKPNCNPLFISPGHKFDLKTSLEFVMHCFDGYRIPKPTREADAYVASVKRDSLKKVQELF
jgi:deoxyribonuclease V